MAQPVSEYHDIQGILRSGYGKLDEASFLLLRIADVRRSQGLARRGCRGAGRHRLPYRVTHAATSKSYLARALQVAIHRTRHQETGRA